MSKAFVSLLFAWCSFALFGQVRIQPGERFKVPVRQTHRAFLSEDASGLHGVSILRQGLNGDAKLLIVDYDTSTMLPLKSTDITPEKKKGVQRNVTQIFTLGSGFVLAVEEIAENNRHQLCLIFLNAQKQQTQTFELKFIEPSISKVWPYELVVAPEEDGFVLTHYPKFRPGTNQKLELYCFDQTMKPNWSDTVDFPEERGGIRFQNFTTDGTKSIYFNYLPERLADSGEEDPRMNIVHFAGYNRQVMRVGEIELQLNKRTILNHHLKITDHGCQMVGWLSRESPSEIEGFFALEVNENMKPIQRTVHDFTKEETASLFPQSGYESPDARKSRVQILSVESLNDNRQVIIGERQKQVIAESANGGNGTAFTEVYYFQDVALIELDSSLNYVNGYQLEKGQVSANDRGEFSSVAWLNFDSGIDFFYNDNPRNKRRRRKSKILKTTSTAQRAKLTGATLTKNLMLQQSINHKGWRSKKVKVKRQEQLRSGGLYFYVRKGFKAQVLKVVRTTPN